MIDKIKAEIEGIKINSTKTYDDIRAVKELEKCLKWAEETEDECYNNIGNLEYRKKIETTKYNDEVFDCIEKAFRGLR